jgi:RNA polymerase sigma-70 factor (ECF subfamily)
MDPESREQRLSRISTLWGLVQQAHGGPSDTARAAQEALLARYSGVIHRYLLGAVRNADTADELRQEFALKFLRGDFKNADPGRGRFRDFLKTALCHLVIDYQRKHRTRAPCLGLELPEPAVAAEEIMDSEREFLESWKRDLRLRSMDALAQVEQKTGQPCHSVLRLSLEQPLLKSAELANQLGARLGKTFTVDAVRQALHRAREKFADLLLNEVVHSLDNPTLEQVEQELIDLGMHSYCRSALERRRGR